MKKAFLTATLLIASSATFASTQKLDQKWVISSIETTEVSSGSTTNGSYGGGYNYRGGYGRYKGGDVSGTGSGQQDPNPTGTFQDTTEKVGTVIGLAKDIVALGESIYTLVQKGKPTNTTEYAPISVLPKAAVAGAEVMWDEMENFSMPTEKKFVTSIKNGVGKEVVRFEYMIIFSHSGSFNGAGKYIAGAEIIPVSVKTSFGWDFNATMKLGGIMNNGSKADPVAGANITIKYQMTSWSSAFERNDLIYINGNGDIKSYSR
ncbi:MAG: hypothetical protein ACOVP4_01985 [Bacteriovoracaceae bacterium]|jgi:hypothetical protein